MKDRIITLAFAMALLPSTIFGQSPNSPYDQSPNSPPAQSAANNSAARSKMVATLLATPRDVAVSVKLANGKKFTGYVESVSKNQFKLRLRVDSSNPYTDFENPRSSKELTIDFDNLRSVHRELLIIKIGKSFSAVFVMGAALPLTFVAGMEE